MPKKFNAVEYLVQKYVEGEYAIIPIKIKKAEDFFTRFDPTQTSLAPEISGYIDRCSYNIPVRFKIKLKVICNEEISEEIKERMQNAVRNHYGLIVFDKGLDLRTNTYKSAWLLLWGIFFLALIYFMGSGTELLTFFGGGESILKEVLLVTGWFFVWEAVENFVSNRRTLRIDKINNQQMLNAELIFENKLEEMKLKPEEELKDEIEKFKSEMEFHA